MIKKIFLILVKVILGIILFITILGFIIIPLVLSWVIPSQGTKYLKHPVHLHSVEFNPFILQLTLNGFDIQSVQNQEMLGFDKLLVEVSFKDLLKKIYHVENFELDGLKVNVELLPKNQINLLELVPTETVSSKVTSDSKPQTPLNESKQATSATNDKANPLPMVIIDYITLHQGQIHFTDKTVTPNFITTLSDMQVNISNVTTDPKLEAKIKFRALLDDKGKISTDINLIPMSQPLEMETTFSLNDYAMGVLTPYVGKYTGRELKNGKLDLTMSYLISDNKLTATHRVMIQRFEFGKSVESKDALHLPFGLAVALLEDPQGKIKIALPVKGDMSDPKFEYTHLIFQVISNFFMKLVTAPFSVLGSILGSSDTGTDELGYVRFFPGKADLSENQKQKIVTLIKSLKERPKLLLEIDGSYDPQVDWKAIQAEIFTKDYAKLRKDSTGPETKVYQLLYQRRFGIRALWALAKKYKKGIGEYQEQKLDQEIKRQLIEHAPPDQGALSVLANARAELVHDFFVSSGFNEQRLSMGHPQATQSSMGYVPLQFTLTVFDKS